MLSHEEKCEIILSTRKGVYEHDIYSWEVLGTDLIKLDQVSNASEVINKTIDDWLESTTSKQRKVFFEINYLYIQDMVNYYLNMLKIYNLIILSNPPLIIPYYLLAFLI